jgi:hypothetical protein
MNAGVAGFMGVGAAPEKHQDPITTIRRRRLARLGEIAPTGVQGADGWVGLDLDILVAESRQGGLDFATEMGADPQAQRLGHGVLDGVPKSSAAASG